MTEMTHAGRLRILFVTTWFPRHDRPLEGTFVREHARAVHGFNDVMVLHSMGPDPNITSAWRMEPDHDRRLTDGVPTYRLWHRRLPVPGLTYLNYVLSVVQAVRTLAAEGFRPDVIHAHIYEAGLPSIVAGRLLGIPVLITEHYSVFPRNLLPWKELLKARLAFSLARSVLPVSHSLQSGIEARGLRARFHVVPNAVNEAFFDIAGSRRARDADGPVRLLTVGQLKPVKGIPVLLEALALVHRRRTDWHLDVVGDGDERATYERLAEELGINKNVTFTPSMSRQELLIRMWRADVFVLSSAYETFSVVTAEALASGLPVVATQCGGPAEFVAPGCGLLVPPGDAAALSHALMEMLDRHAQYDPEALSAYARARFSLDVVGRAMHRIYDDSVHAAPSRVAMRQRLWLWSCILKQIRGVHPADVVGLGLSAIADLAAGVMRLGLDGLPMARVSLQVELARWNLRFWVRAGTDDLYTILPSREQDVHDAIIGRLRHGDTFIDVGANIGYYTLVAGRAVGETGSVVALEPVTDTARQLRRNAAMNDLANVTIVEAAASDHEDARATISIPLGYFGRATMNGSAPPGSRQERIRTVRLDDICADLARVRLMKIDVEGAEARVLDGARATLRKTEYVVVETNTASDDIARFLEALGFAVRRLNFTHHLLAERR